MRNNKHISRQTKNSIDRDDYDDDDDDDDDIDIDNDGDDVDDVGDDAVFYDDNDFSLLDSKLLPFSIRNKSV